MSPYVFDPAAWPVFLTGLAMLILGVAVYRREQASGVSRSFLILTLAVADWLLAIGLMYCSRTGEAAFFWARIAYVGIPLIPPAIYHFTLVLLKRERANVWQIRASWIVSLLFLFLLTGTRLMLTGVYRHWWGYYPRLGPWSAVYLLFFFALLASTLFHYLDEYRRPIGERQKQRVRSFTVAFSIGYLGAIDYLASFGYSVYPAGYLAIAGFLFLAARTIWHYHLVDLTPAFAASQILETMHGAIVVTDSDGVIRLANGGAASMLRVEEAALVGRSMSSVIHSPSIEDRASDTLSRIGSVRERYMVWRRGDGSEVELAVSASNLKDEAGLIVGTVYVAIDIGELKSAERAIDFLNRRHELILNSIGEGVCGIDRNGVTTFANPAAARLTGWQVDELIGEAQHELFHHTRSDGSRFPADDCMLHGKSGLGRVIRSADDLFWRRDGSSFPVDYISNPTFERGEVSGSVLTFNDMTESREAEAQRTQIAREQEANRAKDEFLATLSHELRTPMTAMLGWLQILRSQPPDEATLTMGLASLEQSSRTQARLIEDLLDVARIASGKLQLTIAPVEIADVVRTAADMLRPLAEPKNISIDAIFPEGETIIEGDAERLRQVVWNLVSNAIKFTPSGGRVAIVLKRDDSSAELSVSDTGRGIAPDFLPFVFERYRQAGTDGAQPGLGLGLSIVHHIIELHGGTVRAESSGPWKGATFTVTLPVNPPRA